MRKIPNFIEVLSRRHNISRLPWEQHGDYGSYNPHTGDIVISSEIDESRAEEALMHEIIEVIKEHCDLKISHQTISTLSAVLYHTIVDNQLEFY